MTFASMRNPAIKFRGTRRDLKPCWPAAKTYKTGMTARKTNLRRSGTGMTACNPNSPKPRKKAKHKILSSRLFFSE